MFIIASALTPLCPMAGESKGKKQGDELALKIGIIMEFAAEIGRKGI